MRLTGAKVVVKMVPALNQVEGRTHRSTTLAPDPFQYPSLRARHW